MLITLNNKVDLKKIVYYSYILYINKNTSSIIHRYKYNTIEELITAYRAQVLEESSSEFVKSTEEMIDEIKLQKSLCAFLLSKTLTAIYLCKYRKFCD